MQDEEFRQQISLGEQSVLREYDRQARLVSPGMDMGDEFACTGMISTMHCHAAPTWAEATLSQCSMYAKATCHSAACMHATRALL